MESGYITLLVLAIFIGITVGFIFGKLQAKRRYMHDTKYTQGTLNVDCVDPEYEPGLFLALAVPIKDVVHRKYIALDINVILQNSQK